MSYIRGIYSSLLRSAMLFIGAHLLSLALAVLNRLGKTSSTFCILSVALGPGCVLSSTTRTEGSRIYMDLLATWEIGNGMQPRITTEVDGASLTSSDTLVEERQLTLPNM